MHAETPSIGPYRLLEPLGQGAMGVVYRAQHSLTGTLVALKTVHVPRAAVLQCIRREIHALLRLSHPGVVRVLDAGLDDEKPWYAMELLDGSDLRESWNGRLGVRAPSGIPQAALHEGLGTLHQLCEALAYVHGEGLVHRDLKPGNIFLVRDGRTVLVDFGLASRFAGLGGREALEAAAEAGGTLAYMAPEQGRGQLVDARADLYSLGCILYELLTGRPPFVADHPIQVLRQHFEVEPRPPSELVDGLPGGLEDLVLRLLAKDPRDRIGHADDVAATLAALGAKDGPHEVTPRARPYLYRSGLVGRRAVMDRLRQRLEALQQRRGCLLLIGGESGAGKTRLAVELGREAARLKLQVLAGECLDGPTPPLGALRETLRLVADRCQEGGEHEMQRLLGPRARLLARYEPRIGTLPGVRAQPDPPPLPGQLDRIRLFTALRKTLQALFDRRPGLLLLDDLQWADELTLGFLQFLQQSQRSEAIALLMVGTYRSEQATLQLQDLVRSCPADQRVLLQPLDEAAIGEMAGEMLGLERAPELFGAFLASRCGGSPFFVSEYLHAAVAEELLYRDEQGRWQAVEPAAGAHSADETYTALPLPRSLRQLVERRLEGLPAGAQALVEAAAVIGRQVPLELLRQMLRLEPAALFEAAAEPLRRHVMEEVEPERPQRAASLRFRHDQLREVALERIAPDRRRPLHRAAAEAIEQLDAEARNEHLAELALHWEAAGEPVLARSLYLIAAKGARGRHLHDEAVRLYRAYLRLPATPDAESLQARFELVDCLQHFGGPASEVLEEQARVLAEARFLEDRRAEGECLKLMARTCSISGRIDEASSFLDQALAVARKNGDRHLEGAILDNTGSFHRRLGRKDEARELYRQALQIHADLGNRAFEGASVGNLAALFHEEGRLDEAEALYKQALAIHRTAGSQRWEGHVLSNLGLLCMQRGRIAEARTHCEQALTIHQQIGDRGAAFVLGCLGHLHFRLGHLDQARGLYEQALELDQEFGDPGREGRTLYGLGVVHQALGLHEEAGALYERALELHRSIPDRPFEGFTLGAMASLRFEQGELEVAGKFYEEALDRLREVANRSREGEVLGRSVLLRLAQGDVEDAKARCRQALALARETAEPLNEALALAGAAQVERLGGGELEEARRLVQQALSAMRLIAERLELGPCLCEAGHVELALGRSANRPLSEARRLVEEQDLSPRSALFQAVEKLARAQAAFDKGAVLLRGQCPEDVPAGLRPLLEGIGRASVVSHRGGDMTGMEGTAAPAN